MPAKTRGVRGKRGGGGEVCHQSAVPSSNGVWASCLCWFPCESGAVGDSGQTPPRPENQLPWADPPFTPPGCRVTADDSCRAQSSAHRAAFSKSHLPKAGTLTFPFGKTFSTCDQTGDFREGQTCPKPTEQKITPRAHGPV